MNDDVKQFRWREAMFILEDTSRKIKEIDSRFEITMCVHATLNSYYVTEQRGYDNWDLVAASPYFDVFSTTILNWELPFDFFKHITQRTVEIAKKYNKPSERWIANYYKQPSDFKTWIRLDLTIQWTARCLTYRGGYGTVLAAPDAPNFGIVSKLQQGIGKEIV